MNVKSDDDLEQDGCDGDGERQLTLSIVRHSSFKQQSENKDDRIADVGMEVTECRREKERAVKNGTQAFGLRYWKNGKYCGQRSLGKGCLELSIEHVQF